MPIVVSLRAALFLSLIFIGLSRPANAQFGNGSVKDIEKLSQTTTYVVLGYSDEYNKAMLKAFKEHWNFTPVQFISGAEYNKLCGKKNASFVLQVTLAEYQFTHEEYQNVGILLGDKCRVGIRDMVAYANLLVDEAESGVDDLYASECVRIVQFMQNYLTLATNCSVSNRNILGVYKTCTEDKKAIHNKTLLLADYELYEEFRDINEIKRYYEHSVEHVSYNRIIQATIEQEDDKVYHVLAFDTDGYRYHCMVQAKDSRILYVEVAQKRDVVLIGKRTLSRLN